MTVLRETYGMPGIEPGWPYTRQNPHLLYCHSGPVFIFPLAGPRQVLSTCLLSPGCESLCQIHFQGEAGQMMVHSVIIQTRTALRTVIFILVMLRSKTGFTQARRVLYYSTSPRTKMKTFYCLVLGHTRDAQGSFQVVLKEILCSTWD